MFHLFFYHHHIVNKIKSSINNASWYWLIIGKYPGGSKDKDRVGKVLTSRYFFTQKRLPDHASVFTSGSDLKAIDFAFDFIINSDVSTSFQMLDNILASKTMKRLIKQQNQLCIFTSL